MAIYGLAQDLNRYTRERGISAPIANEQLALTLCILTCCGFVPYVNILTGIGSIVIVILLMKDFKNTAVAILTSRQ